MILGAYRIPMSNNACSIERSGSWIVLQTHTRVHSKQEQAEEMLTEKNTETG